MTDTNESITKLQLDNITLRSMAERMLHETALTFSADSLQGGFCSTVYQIKINDHDLIFKIGTPKNIQMMRHEVNYVPVEAEMLKIINQHEPNLPIPKLLFYDDSKQICPVPYFVMSKIEGKPLSELSKQLTKAQYDDIKYEVAKVTRKINDILVPSFGIPALPETYTAFNSKFVAKVFELLLKDAADKKLTIPGISPTDLLDLIRSKKVANYLDLATGPVLAPTDTWDGNVMVENGHFVGLIDFAAILYADPLMTHDFHDFIPQVRSATLKAYGRTSLNQDELVRIQIYRVWQRLSMIIEPAFRQYENLHVYDWVKPLFVKDVNVLINMLKN